MKLVMFDMDGTLTDAFAIEENCYVLAIEQALDLPGIALVGPGTRSGIPADFADPAAPRALWDAALDRLDGTLDVLINNAGVFDANPIERDEDFNLLVTHIRNMRGKREFFNLGE